jgi:hypothetical protein
MVQVELKWLRRKSCVGYVAKSEEICAIGLLGVGEDHSYYCVNGSANSSASVCNQST